MNFTTDMEQLGTQDEGSSHERNAALDDTEWNGNDNQTSDLDSAQEGDDLKSLHRMELVAHSVLNGPLDQLNETVELLGLSQLILLARLNLMQERITRIRRTMEEGQFTQDKKNQQTLGQIKDLKKRLQNSLKILSKVEDRTQRMNEKLQTKNHI